VTAAPPARPTFADLAEGVHAYARSVVAGDIVAGRLVRLACARHLADIEHGPERGLRWDPVEAGRAIRFFSFLRLKEGAIFQLQPSQVFIVGSLFGWQLADGGRRFRTAYIEEGKGNGKTPMAAGIGLKLTMADGKRGAEVYTAGVTRDQAQYILNDVIAMAEASPDVKRQLEILAHNVAYLPGASYMRPLSSEARSLDQKRVHGALIDEIHEHATDIVVEKMRAGTKGDDRALIVEITNSGYDRTSVCWRHHKYSVAILEGTIDNDSWFAYVAGIDGPRAEFYPFPRAVDQLLESCSCQAPRGAALSILIDRSWREACAEVATTAGSAEPTPSTSESNTSSAIVGPPGIETTSGPTNEIGSPPGQATNGRRPELVASSASASLRKLLQGSATPRAGDAPSAVARELYTSTTTTLQASSGDSSASDATRDSVFSATLRRLFSAHSPTCRVRSLRPERDGLAIDLPGDDWMNDESCWAKANPLLDVVVTRRYLREQVQEARDMPAKAAIVARLNFCVWNDASAGAIDLERWDQEANQRPPEIPEGVAVYAGIDLSSTTDLQTLLIAWEDPAGDLHLEPRFFCPAAAVEMRSRRDHLPYDLWVKDGFIIQTDGDVTDYDVIQAELVKISQRNALAEAGFIRLNATQFVTKAMDLTTMVPIGQTFTAMSAATKDLLARIAAGTVRHGGHPVLRWMAGNLVVDQNKDGDLKPSNAKSTERIGGFSAAVCAIARLTAPHDPPAGDPGFLEYLRAAAAEATGQSRSATDDGEPPPGPQRPPADDYSEDEEASDEPDEGPAERETQAVEPPPCGALYRAPGNAIDACGRPAGHPGGHGPHP